MDIELEREIPRLRAMIDQGKPEAALARIHELIPNHPHADLYTLRLEILLPEFNQFELLADTLGWLKSHNVQAVVMREAEAKLGSEIDSLYTRLEKARDLPFSRLDDLLPLADIYPAFHTLHGFAHYRLIAAYNKRHPDYHQHRQTTVRHDVKVYTAAWSPRPKLFVPERAVEQAEQSLRAALSRMTDDHPYYVITLKLMADLCLFQEDLDNAFEYYQEARSLGLAEDTQLETMKPFAAESVLRRLLHQIDSLILNGHWQWADNLLRQSIIFAEMPDFRVRQGDLALGQQDFTSAITHYQNALDCLDINCQNAIQVLDFDSLMSLNHRLISSQMHLQTRSRTGRPLPLAHHFPAEDARHRATAGLIAVYQQQGNAAAASTLLRAMWGEKALPPTVVQALIELIERNDGLLLEQQAAQLRQQTELDWKAQRWSAVIHSYHTLCGLSTAQPADFAWRAAAMLRGGYPVRDLLKALNAIPPDGLAVVPKGIGLTILDVLRAEKEWAAVERYIPAFKPSLNWRKSYRKALSDFIEQELEAVGQLLHEDRFGDANTRLQDLLAIEPHNVEIRLYQARALMGLGEFGTAETILEQIADQPARHDEAMLALAEIDIQQGDYQRAQERLSSINNLDSDERGRTMHNRLQRLPALEVDFSASRVAMDSLRRVPDETWSATFGVTVKSVRAGTELPTSWEAVMQFLLTLAQASRPDLTAHYAWRYLSRNGRLTITLLCRVEADSAEAAENGAILLWHTLKHVLPLGNEVFVYEPVASRKVLGRLLRPFEVKAAAEITRKEITVMSNGDEVYLVYPFGISQSSLRRTMDMLAEAREPVALDIQFTPTSLLPKEQKAISDLIGGERGLRLFNVLPELDETDAPDFRQSWADAYYPEFLQRTQSLAFVGMVTLAFAGEIDNALVSITGMDLFGTSDFEILRALSEAELATVQQNLAEVTPERWNYTAAPEDVIRWRHLLTPDEMLRAARLPIPDANGLPGVASLKLRMTAMPNRFMPGVMIGESAFPVNGRTVRVTSGVNDRLRHTYIVGRTGSGKSTLIENMALQDIEAGLGVGVIDPHGDLITNILERIPPERAGDVVLFDPSDRERPIALNILDVEGEFERNIVISDFIGLMQKLFDPNYQGFVGPRFENIVRHSMMALTEVMPDCTLIDVVRMVSDSDFRDAVVEKVRDPLVLNYWTNIGKQLDSFGWGSAKGEMIDWLTSKFGRFVDDSMMRHIVGQSKNTLDFEAIMNQKKILLIDLSKGKIGPENSHFLGLLLVPRLLIAAHRRARLRPEQRPVFSLYVDEFHNFTTTAFAEMLSEARKYGLALTMANQFTNQLDAPIREAVFGNVGSMLAFQVGVKDAALLSPEMHPATMDDLINLPNFHLLSKMLIDSQVTPPFPVRTLADTRPANPTLAEHIRQQSRQQYGRELAVVKAEIEGRFKRKP